MRGLAKNLVDTALSPKIIALETIRISWFLGYFFWCPSLFSASSGEAGDTEVAFRFFVGNRCLDG